MDNFSEFERPLAPKKILEALFLTLGRITRYFYLCIPFLSSVIICIFINFLLFPGAQVGMNFYKEIIESAKSGNSEFEKYILENQILVLALPSFIMFSSLVSTVILYPFSAGLIFMTHKI